MRRPRPTGGLSRQEKKNIIQIKLFVLYIDELEVLVCCAVLFCVVSPSSRVVVVVVYLPATRHCF